MSYVTNSVTATGTTASIMGKDFVAVVGEDGASAWVGTVKLKWVDNYGNVHTGTDKDGVEITLTTNNQAVSFSFGVEVTAYLECTAYTSGTILMTLIAQR